MRIQIFSLLMASWPALTFTFAQEGTTKKAAVQESLVTAEGDYVLSDFHFAGGESLPELRLHYRTIGQPVRNPSTGEVENAVRNHPCGLPAGQNRGPKPALAPHHYHGRSVRPRMGRRRLSSTAVITGAGLSALQNDGQQCGSASKRAFRR